MRPIRIYSPNPLQADSEAELGRAAAAHVAQVLRMQPGQHLTLFDGRGGEFTSTIVACTRQSLRVQVLTHTQIDRESSLAVTLWPALARGARFDAVIQKATELGATCIQPVQTERSVVRLDERRAAKKTQHWLDIAISACEQSGRNRLPNIRAPQGLKRLLSSRAEFTHALMLDPQGTQTFPESVSTGGSVVLLTGPEGGLSEAERSAALAAGFTAVQMGPRVLRTETAPLAALAILQVLAGDYGKVAADN
jgi:16S rRNA (uracil1498-N3)-methyltransferase